MREPFILHGRAADGFPDLNLPKLGGLEVLQRLRDDERTRRLPVVLMTSSKQLSDVVRGYDLGANSYVVKPVDFVHFSDVVRHVGRYWLNVNRTLQSDDDE